MAVCVCVKGRGYKFSELYRYTEVYRGIQRYTEVWRGIQRYGEVWRGMERYLTARVSCPAEVALGLRR